jgi:hypothetical protein
VIGESIYIQINNMYKWSEEVHHLVVTPTKVVCGAKANSNELNNNCMLIGNQKVHATLRVVCSILKKPVSTNGGWKEQVPCERITVSGTWTLGNV